MLKVRNVSAGYEGKNVLKNISLDIQPGKITVLAGPNGCGKSTLLKTMLGIVPRTGGKILVSDHRIEDYEPGQLAQ